MNEREGVEADASRQSLPAVASRADQPRSGPAAWERWYPILALTAIGVASFALRFWILSRYAALPSADHGNYLSQVHIFYGLDTRGSGFDYPPMYLLFLAGLLQAFDTMTALKISIALPAAFIPFPAYAIFQRRASKPLAIMGALLLTFAEAYSEMTGWGGGADFLALPFLLAAFYFLLRYLDTSSTRDLIWAAVFTGLVFGTHQLTALILVLTAGFLAMFEILQSRTWPTVSRWARYGALGAAFSAPFAPIYLTLTGRLGPPVTPWWPDGVLSVVYSLVFIFRDSIILWVPIIVFAILGMRLLLRKGEHDGYLYLAMVVICLGLSVTIMHDIATRPLYFLYLPVVGAFVTFCHWALQSAHRPSIPFQGTTKTLLVAALVVSSSVMVAQSVNRMSASVDWYHAIEQPELDGLNWVRDHTPSDAVIATAGLPLVKELEGNRFGWWIEGYSERKAFYTGAVTSYTFTEDRIRIEQANLYFAGNYVLGDSGVRLVDDSPGVPNNPGVSVEHGGTFVPALYLNDAIDVLTYSPRGEPQSNGTWAPFPGARTRVYVVNSTGTPALTVQQWTDQFAVERNETVHGSAASIDLTFTVKNMTLNAVDFDLWVASGLILGDAAQAPNAIAGNLTDQNSLSIPFTVAFSPDPSASVTLTPTNQEPLFGVPAIAVHVATGSNATSLHLGVKIAFPEASSGNMQSVVLDQASEIAAMYRITYVFQSKCLNDMYWRFLTDTQDFSLVYENERIAIFAVNTA